MEVNDYFSGIRDIIIYKTLHDFSHEILVLHNVIYAKNHRSH